jgi:ComEC/Rec2-related protein
VRGRNISAAAPIHGPLARLEAGTLKLSALAKDQSAASWAGRIPPIYSVTFAVILGDALGNFGISAPLWVAVVLAAAALIVLALARPTFGVALALLGIAAAATVPIHWRLASRPDPVGIGRFADGSEVTLRGEVTSSPEHLTGAQTRILVAVRSAGEMEAHSVPTSALVRITIEGPEKLRMGDEILVHARLFFPRNFGNPGEFDYEAYLRRQGIAATMFVPRGPGGHLALQVVGYHPHFPACVIEAIRNRIGEFIDANLTGAERAEMRALVIGDRGGIDERLRSRFALTGMAHLLVISGLHLGFVAAAAFALARLLLGLFPALMARGWANKIAALASALAVAAYASIAGHHVSTIRALVMVLAYTIAIMIDRSREVLASLALAALVICIAFPGSTADIGFQLSFASVAVIILGMRRFTAWWKRNRRARAIAGESASPVSWIADVIAGYFAVSFWALIGTAPLTAYHFNQFSLVGLVANAVVVPIMGFGATVCGLVAAALSFVFPPIAVLVLHAAGAMARAGTWLAGWFVDWPFAWARVFTPTIFELALVYGLLMLWLMRPATGPSGIALRVGGEESGNDDSRTNAAFRRWDRRWTGGVLPGCSPCWRSTPDGGSGSGTSVRTCA